MKVLIADDHSVVREGLKRIVSKIDALSVIETAADGHEALQKIENNSYELVILDISMPGLSGLDILQTLKGRNEKPRVLVLSVHPQAHYAIRTLRLGASGYLSKDSASEELAAAIKTISMGGKYVSTSLAEGVMFGKQPMSEKLPHEKLSDREFQVMCLLASGKSGTEIARELNLSSKTISTHRARILEKMGLKRNAELTLYAVGNDLIE
ncbi:MAG: response regulator transcription factor [Bacteroidota bacterium]